MQRAEVRLGDKIDEERLSGLVQHIQGALGKAHQLNVLGSLVLLTCCDLLRQLLHHTCHGHTGHEDEDYEDDGEDEERWCNEESRPLDSSDGNDPGVFGSDPALSRMASDGCPI